MGIAPANKRLDGPRRCSLADVRAHVQRERRGVAILRRALGPGRRSDLANLRPISLEPHELAYKARRHQPWGRLLEGWG